MIRESNYVSGKIWTWEYDEAGNILNKKEYAYATGTLGSAISTVAYGYPSTTSSEKWKDLLAKRLYELKPYNRNNLRKGVKQIINYNDKLGGGFQMIIVFY